MNDPESITVLQAPKHVVRPAPPVPTKTRRAFVACAVCRDRKTKCVVSPNEDSCQQCKDSGSHCIIGKRSMKRRRSEQETDQMGRRLDALESLLSGPRVQAAANLSPPLPFQMQPGNRISQQASGNSFPIISKTQSNETRSTPRPAMDSDDIVATSRELPPRAVHSGANESVLSKLLSRTGRLTTDAGRLRYFGPTPNLYIYDTFHSLSDPSDPNPAEQEACSMIEGLSGETHTYILEQYWKFYNSIIEVVPKEPFLQGHSADDKELYSVFLHLTMLAIGLRFVDKERPDMVRLMVTPYESRFHWQAKLLVESELERGGRLPSIQALLLLSDLECGCGKDVMGWMYAGMANRLFFDLGLHVNSISLGLSTWEAEVRRKVSIACLMIDKCWSLFFVRPTCVKKSDLETTGFFSNGVRPKSSSSVTESMQQPIIYSAAISLLDISSKVGDSNAIRTSEVDASSHMTMLILHGEIERWYKNLHPAITWEPENIKRAPAGFFLLHQQYHAIRIMLHRPFMSKSKEGKHTIPLDSRSTLVDSSDVCLESGLQLARIFMVSRTRFDIRQSFITAMQHAGNGVTALIEVIASTHTSESRREPMRHLLYLKSVLSELGHVYQHASRMHRVVCMVLEESGWETEYQAIEQKVQAKGVSSPAHPTNANIPVTQETCSPGSTGEKNEKNGSASGPSFTPSLTAASDMWTFSQNLDSGDDPLDISLQGTIRDIDMTDWLQLGQFSDL